jgi:hypothetical protein
VSTTWQAATHGHVKCRTCFGQLYQWMGVTDDQQASPQHHHPQGLPHRQLCIVFQAIIVSRIQYAISAWGGFLILYSKLMLFSFEHAKMVSALTSHLLVYCLLLIKLCLTRFVNLSIVSTQFCHVSKVLCIICESEVMNSSSQTLEAACIKNHLFCIIYIKLFNLVLFL